MPWRMAYPKVSEKNWNVRELTKKFEVNAIVTPEPVSCCDRNKPQENKVNIHRTHAFRLKSQNGDSGRPRYPPKTAYALSKNVYKGEDSSVKSIVEKFDSSLAVSTPEKILKDEYSKVLKKSSSSNFDCRTAISPKINTLRKTVSNVIQGTNSIGSNGVEKQQSVETQSSKHEPLQELVDKHDIGDNVSNNLELTSSLKAALRCPLPKGPPPKKPPRTFAHKNEDRKEEGEMVVTESHRKLVKLKEIVEGGKQSGGDVVMRVKSPVLPRATREQATSVDGKPARSPGDARRDRFVVPNPFGLAPGKLAMFRLCTACLNGGGSTIRRSEYQELGPSKAVPEEHIYDVPFQNTAKPDVQQWPSAEFHCCKEKGLHYMCSDILHKVDEVRISPADGQKCVAEPH